MNEWAPRFLGFGLLLLCAPLLLACGRSSFTPKNLAVDSQNNIIVAGEFYSRTSLGHSALESQGGTDIVVGKMDPQGNWLWARAAGSLGDESPTALTVDAQDNVIMVGTFGADWVGTLVDFGGAKLSTQGKSNLVIAKLNKDGAWQWGTQSKGLCTPVDVVTDQQNNIYVTGYFSGVADFGETQLTAEGEEEYIFVAKLDPNGKWLWATYYGSRGSNYGSGLAVDSKGNVYFSGTFAKLSMSNNSSPGWNRKADILIAKLDSNGKWLWTKSVGTQTYTGAGGKVAVDKNDNVVVTASAGHGFGRDLPKQDINSNSDVFVGKLDPKGEWLWLKGTGNAGQDGGDDIQVDANNNVLIAGSFQHTVLFGSTELTSAGDSDLFLAKLDSDGNWLWARRAGTPKYDFSCGMVLDREGFAITGLHWGGFGTGIFSGAPGEFANDFVWKRKPGS
ncbi:MAG: hypothetical protein EP343_29310 [Deltaproteobacteria bacterium]|nr:MAG: hypothetical protein EP343_29310 [Deltaproteobacteria bacterium]